MHLRLVWTRLFTMHLIIYNLAKWICSSAFAVKSIHVLTTHRTWVCILFSVLYKTGWEQKDVLLLLQAVLSQIMCNYTWAPISSLSLLPWLTYQCKLLYGSIRSLSKHSPWAGLCVQAFIIILTTNLWLCGWIHESAQTNSLSLVHSS